MDQAVKKALPQIQSFFAEADQKIYMQKELHKILYAQQNKSEKNQTWNLPGSYSASRFINDLLKYTSFQKIVLGTTDNQTSVIRYAWGSVTPYEVALSIAPGTYLSHGTAVYLHDLNDRLPKTIYVNKEQTKKKSSYSVALTQAGIDNAFSKAQRRSTREYPVGDYRVVALSGKYSGNLGVEQITGAAGELIKVTSVERTLIDIAVRPAYAGGVYQVLAAYEGAKETVSITKLIAIFKKMDFVYPYQQVLGFYLEKAGYPERILKRIEPLISEFNFYLDYDLSENNRAYNSRWRLFHPKGF